MFPAIFEPKVTYHFPEFMLVIGYSSSNILYNDYEEEYPKYHLSRMSLFLLPLPSCYTFPFASTGKNKLNISEFYRDSITFRTIIMHTPTIFDQTDRSGTARYDGTGPDEYLSDSSSCTDSRSDLGLDNYNDYESNYESDNEEATCASTNITTTKSFQYSLRQEKFNVKFSPKDLLNAIREILLSPPRDMSNEKGSSLYNAYDRSEVEDKLVIKIDQDGDHAPKFSVTDDISEVYGLPGIHECIVILSTIKAD